MSRVNRMLATIVLSVMGMNTICPSSPSTKDSEASAIASLRSLAENQRLELSTEPTSIQSKFCIEIKLTPLDPNVTLVRNLFIVRDSDKTAILARANQKECYTYCSNGELITVDHDHPGTLKETTDGNFLMKVDWPVTDEKFTLYYGFSCDQKAPGVMIDFNSILSQAALHGKSTQFDESRKCFEITTDDLELSIFLDPRENPPFPLKSLTLRSKKGVLEISISHCGLIPANLLRLLDRTAIEQKIAAMGLIIHNIPIDPKIPPEAFACVYSTPTEIGKNPKERELIVKFTKAVTPQGAERPPDSRP
jgi:hypothetical protein